jgi:two-component system invasion response regulator UvrY
MNILLIDDHAIVRAGLKQMLSAMLDATVHEVPSAEAALLALATLRPDLVLLDLGLPGLGGLALLPRLVALNLRVLVLSMHAEPIYAQRALDGGALGYVSKNTAPEELLIAIRTVAAGRKYLEQRIAQDLALQRVDSGNRLHQLTDRDLEITRHLAAGRSLQEIADILGVSYKTVANSTGLIRAKLGVARTADLIRWSIEMSTGTADRS